MTPPPKVGRASLFALHHPWIVSVLSGVGIALGMHGRLHYSWHDVLIAGALMTLMQAILWFPMIGPARRYTERLLADEAKADPDYRPTNDLGDDFPFWR